MTSHTPEITHLSDQGPQIRLFVCKTCRTVEEVPDYEGDPRDDVLLQLSIERHVNALGIAHGKVRLFRVPVSQWSRKSVRAEILKQLPEDLSTGLDAADKGFYDTKSTFHEDALKCFAAHRRPKGQCPDFMSDSKKLVPNTHAERKELGLAPPSRANVSISLCRFCVTGDTEVVTRYGIKRIDEVVGKPVRLLVPDATMGSRGKFSEVEVRYFGNQPTQRITLRRHRTIRVVEATPEHRWFVQQLHPQSGKPLSTEIKTTSALSVGDKLAPQLAVPLRGSDSPIRVAIAQGFTYGDGCKPAGDRPASITFYAEKDEAVIEYFSGFTLGTTFVNGAYHPSIYGLPRTWKDLPTLTESRIFLLSWLSGYFAADGTVDRNGCASISSASRDSLEFVRSVAAICGVRTHTIRKKTREGFGKMSDLFNLGLDAEGLPNWFWHVPTHRERVENRFDRRTKRARSRNWTVVSVEEPGEEVPVYCAVVPGVEAFALADDLLTGNCPVFTYNVTRARAEKGMYK